MLFTQAQEMREVKWTYSYKVYRHFDVWSLKALDGCTPNSRSPVAQWPVLLLQCQTSPHFPPPYNGPNHPRPQGGFALLSRTHAGLPVAVTVACVLCLPASCLPPPLDTVAVSEVASEPRFKTEPSASLCNCACRLSLCLSL